MLISNNVYCSPRHEKGQNKRIVEENNSWGTAQNQSPQKSAVAEADRAWLPGVWPWIIKNSCNPERKYAGITVGYDHFTLPFTKAFIKEIYIPCLEEGGIILSCYTSLSSFLQKLENISLLNPSVWVKSFHLGLVLLSGSGPSFSVQSFFSWSSPFSLGPVLQ